MSEWGAQGAERRKLREAMADLAEEPRARRARTWPRATEVAEAIGRAGAAVGRAREDRPDRGRGERGGRSAPGAVAAGAGRARAGAPSSESAKRPSASGACGERAASGIRLQIELAADDPRVVALLGEEVVGGARLGQAAVVHDQDLVDPPDRGEPVGDHQRRAPAHQREEAGHHLGLALHVERARRLVHEQDRRVLQERAGQVDPLLLPDTQARAPVSDDRSIVLGQLLDELVGPGGVRGGLDLLHRRVGLPVGDVLGHGGRAG